MSVPCRIRQSALATVQEMRNAWLLMSEDEAFSCEVISAHCVSLCRVRHRALAAVPTDVHCLAGHVGRRGPVLLPPVHIRSDLLPHARRRAQVRDVIVASRFHSLSSLQHRTRSVIKYPAAGSAIAPIQLPSPHATVSASAAVGGVERLRLS